MEQEKGGRASPEPSGDPAVMAYLSAEPFDCAALYRDFLAREGEASGTLLTHHGRVKRPGKKVPDFSAVELRAIVPDVEARLAAIARRARADFGLERVLLVHRLGRVGAGDTVLLAIVSGRTRGPCFEACSWIVDEVKKEEAVELVELP